MQRSIYLFFISLIFLLLFGVQANAYVTGSGFLCVDGSGAANLSVDFQEALTNGVTSINDEVRIISGTYRISDVSDAHFQVTANHSLEISGGWNADCSTQKTGSPGLTILEGGTTQTDPGGVLSVTIQNNPPDSTVSIHNLTINDGSSYKSGGGLYIFHTATLFNLALSLTVNLNDIIAEFNETEIFGSGISIFDDGTPGGMYVNISDCIVRDNTFLPSTSGGPAGIHIDTLSTGEGMADTFISNCQILNNTALQDGGGLYINSGTGDTTLVNNVIAGNTATNFGGGGANIFNNDTAGGDITITNNTITGNTADNDNGGGLLVDLGFNDPSPENTSSSIDIYNNIIWGNFALNGIAEDFNISNLHGNIVNILNNDFNNTPTTGFSVDGDQTNVVIEDNLDIDPDFNAAIDNYHLDALSPVIDQGLNAAPLVPSDDLDGAVRPLTAPDPADMGAYEYISPGDVNGDSTVNLADTILILQLITGTSSVPVFIEADVNNDVKIGIQEAIYTLQSTAGLR
jgi:hypothetical protein